MNSADSFLELTRTHESTAANTFRVSMAPPVFLRGEGPWLFDQSGAKWLDFACGSGTSNLGHNHPAHIEALHEAIATGILHTGTRLPSPFRARLYGELASILPAGRGCIQLANSGAEANEAAVKAAQYFTGRKRLISFAGGYHGRTLGALSVTDGERIRAPFPVFRKTVDFMPYACSEGSGRGGSDWCLAQLKTRLRNLERNDKLPAAVIIEPIQGVAGVRSAPTSFLAGVRELTRRHKILMICDEIWSGLGRSGRWFSFENAGVVPDLVTMGKGLSGGLPLSAVAAAPAILKAWPPGMHTSTFQGNPLACNMAVATIRTIREEGLLDHVANAIEPALERMLRPLSEHERVADIRVSGAQAAIEIVDGSGHPDARAVHRLQAAALERQLLVYAGGRHVNSVMIVPPVNISERDLVNGLSELVGLIRNGDMFQ